MVEEYIERELRREMGLLEAVSIGIGGMIGGGDIRSHRISPSDSGRYDLPNLTPMHVFCNPYWIQLHETIKIVSIQWCKLYLLLSFEGLTFMADAVILKLRQGL